MAGYIGYEEGGIIGGIIGVFATVAPSLFLMIILLGFLYRYKESPKVKRMTSYIRPTIAVLLGVMAFNFFFTSYSDSGIWQTLFLVVISFLLLERWKVHPALVIMAAMCYGAVFMG
jgi:chromate transporter